MPVHRKKILFDSNIWIYSFDKAGNEKYEIAKDLRKKAVTQELNVFITPQNYTESFRALTDKNLFKNPFTPEQAEKELRKIWSNLDHIFPKDETILKTQELIKKYPEKSKSLGIYDLFLTASMLTAKITTLYTDNTKDFSNFKEIILLNPFATANDIHFRGDRRTRDQLSIIKKILKTAQDCDKFIFLKGGWNIDLSFGRPTRNHDDIDFHFEKKDIAFWKSWFKKQGFGVEEKDEWYMIFKTGSSHIDFEAVEISDQNIVWKKGNISELSDVVEKGTWKGIEFKKMKLDVEEYLKHKFLDEGHKDRDKDLHDLAILDLLKE